jgi:hypothetical protein
MAKLITLPNSRPANPAESQVIHAMMDEMANFNAIINAEGDEYGDCRMIGLRTVSRNQFIV